MRLGFPTCLVPFSTLPSTRFIQLVTHFGKGENANNKPEANNQKPVVVRHLCVISGVVLHYLAVFRLVASENEKFYKISGDVDRFNELKHLLL